MRIPQMFKLFILLFISSRCTAAFCPAGDFDNFSRIFINDVEVQTRYTINPVNIVFYQELDDDVKEVKESRFFKLSDFPIVSSKGTDGEREVKIDKDNLVVDINGNDTGYQVSLSFSEKDKCWYLVKITDHSM
ncbi:MAG: hypothetical protein ACRCU2_21660 [Planktothrix sp.]